MPFILVSEIVEANGRTVRENNLALRHKHPIGTLVEVKYDEWHGGGASEKVHARLFVLLHTRDCDGSPLYVLGRRPPSAEPDWVEPADLLKPNTPRGQLASAWYQPKRNLGEDGLTPIELTPALLDGYGALRWDDEADAAPSPTGGEEPAP